MDRMTIIALAFVLVNNLVWVGYRRKYMEYMFNLWNDERNRADALGNTLAAIDVREEHYPALQQANATLNNIVTGIKARLSKSEQAPFARYTARFEHFEDLVVFLVFDVNREEFDAERNDRGQK